MTDISEVAHGIYQIETDDARIPGGMGFPRSSLVFFMPGPPRSSLRPGRRRLSRLSLTPSASSVKSPPRWPMPS